MRRNPVTVKKSRLDKDFSHQHSSLFRNIQNRLTWQLKPFCRSWEEGHQLSWLVFTFASTLLRFQPFFFFNSSLISTLCLMLILLPNELLMAILPTSASLVFLVAVKICKLSCWRIRGWMDSGESFLWRPFLRFFSNHLQDSERWRTGGLHRILGYWQWHHLFKTFGTNWIFKVNSPGSGRS